MSQHQFLYNTIEQSLLASGCWTFILHKHKLEVSRVLNWKWDVHKNFLLLKFDALKCPPSQTVWKYSTTGLLKCEHDCVSTWAKGHVDYVMCYIAVLNSILKCFCKLSRRWLCTQSWLKTKTAAGCLLSIKTSTSKEFVWRSAYRKFYIIFHTEVTHYHCCWLNEISHTLLDKP